MEKRYQVFVSSTYIDLVEERSEVMQALLELNCMPAGMELFPAANDTQWAWIKRIIDESDYYIVIIGGRYGSTSKESGLSYTEMEYRYAVEVGKPVIGFLHEDPSIISSANSEQDERNRKKLREFRAAVQSRLVKYWAAPADLGAKVSRSITQLIKQHPAIGWVKADQIPTYNNPEELLNLHKQIQELNDQLDSYVDKAVGKIKALSSGSDKVVLTINFNVLTKYPRLGKTGWKVVRKGAQSIQTTWDEILKFLAPKLVSWTTEYQLEGAKKLLATHLWERKPAWVGKTQKSGSYQLSSDSSNMIMIQLLALYIIEYDEKGNYWRLSEHGNRHLTESVAIKKK